MLHQYDLSYIVHKLRFIIIIIYIKFGNILLVCFDLTHFACKHGDHIHSMTHANIQKTWKISMYQVIFYSTRRWFLPVTERRHGVYTCSYINIVLFAWLTFCVFDDKNGSGHTFKLCQINNILKLGLMKMLEKILEDIYALKRTVDSTVLYRPVVVLGMSNEIVFFFFF